MSFFLTPLLISLLFVNVDSAQDRYFTYDGVYAPTTANFIIRAYQASIVSGDYLYIDGGEIYQLVDGNIYAAPNNATLSVDLTQSWANETVSFNVINKTGDYYNAWNSGYLWLDEDNSSFFAWGGQRSSLRVNLGTPISAQSEFAPDGNGGGIWTNDIGQIGGSIFSSLKRGVGCANVKGSDTWYSLGGYRTCYSDPSIYTICEVDVLGPLVSYNETNEEWYNSSAAGFSGGQSAIWSQMQNVPWGSTAGLNILFGGGDGSGSESDPSGSLLSMSDIYIYDPSTEEFYSQTTTGDTPAPRTQFCSVGVPGPNGTYEIFIYGGHNGGYSPDQQAALSDAVYVLSLPGFVWHQANIPAVRSRVMHSCNVVGSGGSQMVIIGGYDPTAPNLTVPYRDTWPNGIAIFDLNLLEWKTSYEPKNSQYQTPKIIRDWYAKNGKAPIGGYLDPTVATLFAESKGISLTPTSSAVASSTVGSTPTSQPTGTPPAPPPHTGVIAGGVVGGVALLALVSAAFFLARRSKRRASKGRPAAGPGAQPEKPELPGHDINYSSTQNRGIVELPGAKRYVELDGAYRYVELDGANRYEMG